MDSDTREKGHMGKSKGLFTFITGIAVGAAAIFLSKKENREATQEYAAAAKKQLHKWAKEYNKNPEKFKQKMLDEGQKFADTTLEQIKEKAAELKEKEIEEAVLAEEKPKAKKPVNKKTTKAAPKKA